MGDDLQWLEWIMMGCTLIVLCEAVAHCGATVQLQVERWLEKRRVRKEINRFVRHFGK